MAFLTVDTKTRGARHSKNCTTGSRGILTTCEMLIPPLSSYGGCIDIVQIVRVIPNMLTQLQAPRQSHV